MAKAILQCRPASHPFNEREISLTAPVKIGRAVAGCKPQADNGYFNCKVLSRNHAVLWYENGKVREEFSATLAKRNFSPVQVSLFFYPIKVFSWVHDFFRHLISHKYFRYFFPYSSSPPPYFHSKYLIFYQWIFKFVLLFYFCKIFLIPLGVFFSL